MPIMAAHEQSDIRGSARLLANMVRGYVRERPAIDRHHKVYLNNLYRLLEGYRTHRFVAFEYEPRSLGGAEALTLLPPAETNVRELRTALEEALRSAYAGEPEDNAVKSVEGVLKAIASSTTVSKADTNRATKFLDNFIRNLEPAD